MYKFKQDLHRPPHLFQDNTYYFIMAKTIKGIKFFNTPSKKKILLKVVKGALQQFDFSCQSWVILDNHYQLVIKVRKSKYLSVFIKKIHGQSTKKLNELENKVGRNIWSQYWDKCLRNERDFWLHVNYNHHNPVKHGYTARMKDYQFSSYKDYLEKFGQEFLDMCFERYPVVDFTPSWLDAD